MASQSFRLMELLIPTAVREEFNDLGSAQGMLDMLLQWHIDATGSKYSAVAREMVFDVYKGYDWNPETERTALYIEFLNSRQAEQYDMATEGFVSWVKETHNVEYKVAFEYHFPNELIATDGMASDHHYSSSYADAVRHEINIVKAKELGYE